MTYCIYMHSICTLELHICFCFNLSRDQRQTGTNWPVNFILSNQLFGILYFLFHFLLTFQFTLELPFFILSKKNYQVMTDQQLCRFLLNLQAFDPHTHMRPPGLPASLTSISGGKP